MAHALPLADAAGAQSIDEARAAYAEGRFADAARIGETLGTSQGFALAAESLTIHAHFIAADGEKEALFERAIGLARKAVRSDSGNANAHLQLARAIGRHAQTIGSFEAANQGYAEKIREATENALRANPEMVSAHLSLGRWHAELVGTVGSFTRCFQAWIEQLLIPTLSPGDIVILDNLASHKGKAVRHAIRGAGARLWFLPPCSPDLNPIEQTFAKIKHWMRDAQKRTVDGTWRHLGNLIDTIQPDECQNYIRNAGYGSN